MSDTTAKFAFSIYDVAQLTGLGRSLLFEEIRAGRLLVKKAGRRTVVLRADLENWLTNLPQKGSGATTPITLKSKTPK